MTSSALLLAVQTLASAAGLAQHAAQTATHPDSARLVRSARSAQAGFESFRRSRLPMGDRGGSGPCDVKIGRYCYWRGDGDGDEERDPPAEDRAVTDRREELIRVLDSTTRAVPGDAWVAGQYVRYLIEAKRYDDALRYAGGDCGASAWWCAALGGLTAHSIGRFTLADSLYSRSLAAMDSTERCHWLDVSDVLSDELHDRFERLDCSGRAALARRMLIVGAPLYSVATTDLWTEHLARVTRGRIAERAATPDGEVWANDEQELVIRYGWPQWYSRTQPEFGSQLRPSITGHDVGMPYYFLPTSRVLDHPGLASTDDWQLDDPRAPSGYAPSYTRSIHSLRAQIAVFRRGDSTLVAAAWDARQDTTMLGRALRGALVLTDADTIRGMTTDTAARTTGHLISAAPLDSGLISLELLAPKEHRAARTRVGFAARSPEVLALSDLLLTRGSSSPTDLGTALDSALAGMEVPMSRNIGIYWETYGLRAGGGPVQYTLSVQQVGTSWMRRAAARLHLSDPTTGLRIQWEEMPRITEGIASRGVHLDLSRLRGGTYDVELTARAGGMSTTTKRQLAVH